MIRAGYSIAFAVDVATPMIAMLSVHPSRMADLQTPHRLDMSSEPSRRDYQDAFGNICTRLILPPGETTLSTDFIIADTGEPDLQSPDAVQHAVDDLPDEVIVYLLGSRYCDTDRLSDVAWSMFGATAEGWPRVQAIVDFAHGHMTYGYEHASSTRTAWDGYQDRVGVCRDFAHLAVTLCRCMNIPARYCSGYLGDIGVVPPDVAMDFHAWFEVYLGGCWHSFDARHRHPRIGRILMACGRDATDTALTTAFGPTRLVGFEVHTDEILTPELSNVG